MIDIREPLRIDILDLDAVMGMTLDQPRPGKLNDGFADRRDAEIEVLTDPPLAHDLARLIKAVLNGIAYRLGGEFPFREKLCVVHRVEPVRYGKVLLARSARHHTRITLQIPRQPENYVRE